jgi:hypothetical protein
MNTRADEPGGAVGSGKVVRVGLGYGGASLTEETARGLVAPGCDRPVSFSRNSQNAAPTPTETHPSPVRTNRRKDRISYLAVLAGPSHRSIDEPSGRSIEKVVQVRPSGGETLIIIIQSRGRFATCCNPASETTPSPKSFLTEFPSTDLRPFEKMKGRSRAP